MSTLTGLYISQSYGGLIHLSTNTGISVGTFTTLQDGLGNNLGVSVNGNGHVSASVFSGSLAGTASYAQSSLSSSYAQTSLSSSFATSASYAPSTPTFPYTGNAVISGSLTITGSVQTKLVNVAITSNTASLDLSSGTIFFVTLTSGTTTNFQVTNLKPGVTGNVIISSNTNCTASFGSNILKTSTYSPTNTSGSKDILSFITDSTKAYLVSATNFS